MQYSVRFVNKIIFLFYTKTTLNNKRNRAKNRMLVPNIIANLKYPAKVIFSEYSKAKATSSTKKFFIQKNQYFFNIWLSVKGCPSLEMGNFFTRGFTSE